VLGGYGSRVVLLVCASATVALAIAPGAWAGVYRYGHVPSGEIYGEFDDIFQYHGARAIAGHADPAELTSEQNNATLTFSGPTTTHLPSTAVTLSDKRPIAPAFQPPKQACPVAEPVFGCSPDTARQCDQPGLHAVTCRVPATSSTISLSAEITLGAQGDVLHAHGTVNWLYVNGGPGADRLVGAPDATNYAGSQEILTGGDGNDIITGSAAANDLVSGEAGDDLINVRDGNPDQVDCGPGTDVALVDSADVDVTACETVTVG